MFELTDQQRDEYVRECVGRWHWGRKWHQYRLSNVFLLMTLVAVIFGAGKMLCDQHEQEALVQRLGGTSYMLRRPGLLDVFTLRPRPIHGVDFSGARITDHDLPLLRRLPRLEELDLTGTGITDRGLGYLSQLSTLKRLDVTRTWVTDAAIEELAATRPDLVVGPLEKPRPCW